MREGLVSESAAPVMDRLVSPGGDPWKQQQTHESLAQYLLEAG